jgi:hypothetical protein
VVVEPFLIVGIVAAVGRLIVISADAGSVSSARPVGSQALGAASGGQPGTLR